MSDGRPSNYSYRNIVPSGNRGLTTRSSVLVQRGLDALRFQQPRAVRFPADHSMGMLYMRNRGDPGWNWEKIGEACGNVMVPGSKELSLEVTRTKGSRLYIRKPQNGLGVVTCSFSSYILVATWRVYDC